MKNLKQFKGITLVALVVTIILLLILAGITISQLTGSGLFENAKLAEERSKNAQEKENEILSDYQQWMDQYLENDRNGTETEEVTNIEAGATHTSTVLTYSWKELGKIAKAISDNDEIIDNNTAEVKVTIGKNKYIVGVGDTTTVTYEDTEYTVRILGFNHDKLVVERSYSETKKNTYAGISFEFVDFIMSSSMNSTRTNSGGWKSSGIRETLNSVKINSLSNSYYIKEVAKVYTYDSGSTGLISVSRDRLWLLSYSEIWETGYFNKEEEQFKYYKDALATDISIIKGGNIWWLRSLEPHNSAGFAIVSKTGASDYGLAEYAYGIAPCFSI